MHFNNDGKCIQIQDLSGRTHNDVPATTKIVKIHKCTDTTAEITHILREIMMSQSQHNNNSKNFKVMTAKLIHMFYILL